MVLFCFESDWVTFFSMITLADNVILSTWRETTNLDHDEENHDEVCTLYHKLMIPDTEAGPSA